MYAQHTKSVLRSGLTAGVVGVALIASGCGGGDAGPAAEPADAPQEKALTIADPWVKASDEGMTSAFGILVNDGTDDLRIVSSESSMSTVVELHEVVMTDGEMLMREKADGFVVPAGGEHLLEPGADHLMLMDLTAPIAPGDDVDFVLTLDDGSTFEFTAQAKDFAGGDEDYQPDDEGALDGDDDHGDGRDG